MSIQEDYLAAAVGRQRSSSQRDSVEMKKLLTHQRPRITNADKTLPFFSALRLDLKFNLITLKNTYCIGFDK